MFSSVLWALNFDDFHHHNGLRMKNSLYPEQGNYMGVLIIGGVHIFKESILDKNSRDYS